MEMNRIRREPRQLFLDALFVVLLLHVFVTGQIVPQVVVDLFHDKPQIVVSTEPEFLPESPDAAPIHDDSDQMPETRSGGQGYGAAV